MVVLNIEHAYEDATTAPEQHLPPPLRTASFKIGVQDFKFYKLSDLRIWNEMGVLVCDAGDPSLDEVPIFEVGERKGMGWLLCFIVFWIGLYWFGLVCIDLF